ncbi:MAG: aspartate carbamoyltransferase catalytic subunit [Ponticaulis sp.]|nr:aspartate carbamoyltransferase catalytic subunit [Ponticaulis sp.]|tara:strand:+ start:28776 stop:29723 length:948 start_codon:yes stop_codon:yes gene_type:complete
MSFEYEFPHRHLLGIEGLNRLDIEFLLNRSEELINTKTPEQTLAGKTLINMFFENSTRTQGSFEISAKRLGADVVNMAVQSSSVKKGETLVDTAMTLNAMEPDLLVIRHGASGGVRLLSRKVDCAVVNAGDGTHEHPTQALLDALTIRRRKGRLEGLKIAICGDILHSRVARSNTMLLHQMGAEVRLVGPPTLLPPGTESWGAASLHTNMIEGVTGCDVVMMLRLQLERMNGMYLPSKREFFQLYGLDEKKLEHAATDALIMHPGPMNRGVEIDSAITETANSTITEQVSMGVYVRMAVLETLARNLDRSREAST